MEKVEKYFMLPETADMFSRCVHSVHIRQGINYITVFKWLRANISPTETGFMPWVRNGPTIQFLREGDAVMCALMWG